MDCGETSACGGESMNGLPLLDSDDEAVKLAYNRGKVPSVHPYAMGFNFKG